MQILRWQETTAPQEQDLYLRMQRDGLTPYKWSNGPGESYAVHNHTYEKVLYCVRGSSRFVLHDLAATTGDTDIVDLAPGDCMVLPAGIQHSAHVGSQGVICLEAAR